MSRRRWPDWWAWELELGPHLLKRMTDRRFSEIELRRMLERASGHRDDIVESRWIIEAPPRQGVGGYRRTRPGATTAGGCHRLPGLGVRG